MIEKQDGWKLGPYVTSGSQNAPTDMDYYLWENIIFWNFIVTSTNLVFALTHLFREWLLRRTNIWGKMWMMREDILKSQWKNVLSRIDRADTWNELFCIQRAERTHHQSIMIWDSLSLQKHSTSNITFTYITSKQNPNCGYTNLRRWHIHSFVFPSS